jgi:bifunctional DNA-binding transcriptional regulator/antitoxin component of YhaV-PrlF toxin-antitoxin module
MKNVRDKLNLKPGDKILMEMMENTAFIRPLGKTSETMKGIKEEDKDATELLREFCWKLQLNFQF